MVAVEIPTHLSHSQSSNLSAAEHWVGLAEHEGWYATSRGQLISSRRGSLRVIGSRTGDYATVQERDGRVHRVHRLICKAFHGPPPAGAYLVRHLNDNPRDNRPENLAWGTDQDNTDDKVAHGRAWSPGPRKLTPEQALEIRNRYDAGEGPAAIAADYPIITPNQVIHIGKRRSWKGLS